VADNDGYADYYDDSPATHDILYYDWASFFGDDENNSDFKRVFIHINSQKTLWQANTSEVDLDLYGGHIPEKIITVSKIVLDLFAGSTNTRVFTGIIFIKLTNCYKLRLSRYQQTDDILRIHVYAEMLWPVNINTKHGYRHHSHIMLTSPQRQSSYVLLEISLEALKIK